MTDPLLFIAFEASVWTIGPDGRPDIRLSADDVAGRLQRWQDRALYCADKGQMEGAALASSIARELAIQSLAAARQSQEQGQAA